jgi:hypothetical protein
LEPGTLGARDFISCLFGAKALRTVRGGSTLSHGCKVVLKPIDGAHPFGPETNLTAVATFDTESTSKTSALIFMIAVSLDFVQKL